MLIISVLASQILFPSPFKASLSPNVFVSNYLQKKFYYLKDILLEIVPARLVLTKTTHLLLSKVSLCLSTQWFTIYWISINFLKYGSLSKSNWKISSIVNHCFCPAALTSDSSHTTSGVVPTQCVSHLTPQILPHLRPKRCVPRTSRFGMCK